MNEGVEEFYQRIGAEAVAMTPDGVEDLLVYAEVEDGSTDCGLFYRDSAGRVIYKECNSEFFDLIYSFWEYWQDSAGLPAFSTMTYSISSGEFNIDLKYPDQIIESEGIDIRRERALHQHFGNMAIDYSNP